MGELNILSFIAGAAIAIVGAWIIFSAKTRILNEKIIRYQAESEMRTSISNELKQELTTATDEVINPVKDYMTKEVGRVEQLKIEAVYRYSGDQILGIPLSNSGGVATSIVVGNSFEDKVPFLSAFHFKFTL